MEPKKKKARRIIFTSRKVGLLATKEADLFGVEEELRQAVKELTALTRKYRQLRLEISKHETKVARLETYKKRLRLIYAADKLKARKVTGISGIEKLESEDVPSYMTRLYNRLKKAWPGQS